MPALAKPQKAVWELENRAWRDLLERQRIDDDSSRIQPRFEVSFRTLSAYSRDSVTGH
jgi:hypothetical protein